MELQLEDVIQWTVFKRLFDEQNNEIRQKYDIKKVELEVLYFLSRSGDLNTSSDIHRQLKMNKGHISQAVDALCSRNYIVPVQDTQDRRYVHYEVQDVAKELIEEITQKRHEINELILKDITEEELQIFRKVSEKIRNNIENMF